MFYNYIKLTSTSDILKALEITIYLSSSHITCLHLQASYYLIKNFENFSLLINEFKLCKFKPSNLLSVLFDIKHKRLKAFP